jgi:hypothetical protein
MKYDVPNQSLILLDELLEKVKTVYGNLRKKYEE